MTGLNYIGNGRYLGGVPARDLTKAEIDDLKLRGKDRALLLRSGLYEELTPPKPKRSRSKRSKRAAATSTEETAVAAAPDTSRSEDPK